MQRPKLNNLLGGVIAGFLAIPESMAYAVIIFSPFAIYQPEILPLGVAACVLAVVFANLIPSLTDVIVLDLLSDHRPLWEIGCQEIISCKHLAFHLQKTAFKGARVY